MSYRNSKVVIVGAGNVGSTTAYSIINQGICEDLCLIDARAEVALGQALDMSDAVNFMHRNMSVHAGGYEECADADIVVVTAAAPMPKDSNDRLEMLKPSLGVVREVVTSVMDSGFNGIFIVVSNPVDIMTYYTWRVSGLPRERVIGSGTYLDTARLCRMLSEMYDLAPASVEAYVLGEHGDSEIVSWNSATIGGKRVDDVLRDNESRTKGVTRDDLRRRTIQAGWDIFSRKGNTCYGIASSTTAIAKSILFDENRIMPVSVCLSGQYGIDGTYLSVPTIVDHTGAKEIVEIALEADELAALQKSAELLHSFYPRLGE
ncbi:MAG: L-lactate dehydrogenase [Olegusella sp.]|nr:L-lactate dehydrogenase [Olegusella sp.]